MIIHVILLSYPTMPQDHVLFSGEIQSGWYGSALVKAGNILDETGYDELSLLSLSSGDYPDIDMLFESLLSELSPQNISISLPSLRVEEMIKNLPFYLSKIKKSGLTFAPEAGSERLRNHIGKNINISYLKDAARAAYEIPLPRHL